LAIETFWSFVWRPNFPNNDPKGFGQQMKIFSHCINVEIEPLLIEQLKILEIFQISD
jgi:hypothetical protein